MCGDAYGGVTRVGTASKTGRDDDNVPALNLAAMTAERGRQTSFP